jgi:hypothetical protein
VFLLIRLCSFLGWFAPSNIAVPAFGNQSLFGAFTKSIGEELAHFPVVRMKRRKQGRPMCSSNLLGFTPLMDAWLFLFVNF